MNENNTVNKVFLIGKISRAPRWHKNITDGNMLFFTLTTSETYQQQGKSIEQTEEHSVKLPERYFKSDLRLGQTVHIEGKIKTSVFQDEQNIRRYRTEVIALRVTSI